MTKQKKIAGYVVGYEGRPSVSPKICVNIKEAEESIKIDGITAIPIIYALVEVEK